MDKPAHKYAIIIVATAFAIAVLWAVTGMRIPVVKVHEFQRQQGAPTFRPTAAAE